MPTPVSEALIVPALVTVPSAPEIDTPVLPPIVPLASLVTKPPEYSVTPPYDPVIEHPLTIGAPPSEEIPTWPPSIVPPARLTRSPPLQRPTPTEVAVMEPALVTITCEFAVIA